MALLLAGVLWLLTLWCLASDCVVVRYTFTLTLHSHILFPPSPLFSSYTLHPHHYPLILYVPPQYLGALPGAVAGRGVYAMRDFEEGDAIIQYDGRDLGGEHDAGIEDKKRGKRHLLAVNGRVLDGKWHVAGALNTATAMHGNNVGSVPSNLEHLKCLEHSGRPTTFCWAGPPVSHGLAWPLVEIYFGEAGLALFERPASTFGPPRYPRFRY